MMDFVRYHKYNGKNTFLQERETKKWKNFAKKFMK